MLPSHTAVCPKLASRSSDKVRQRYRMAECLLADSGPTGHEEGLQVTPTEAEYFETPVF